MFNHLSLYLKASDKLNTSFRNLLDYGSAEYKFATDEFRVKKLKQVYYYGFDFGRLIAGYKVFYIKEGKPHVIDAIPASLLFLARDFAHAEHNASLEKALIPLQSNILIKYDESLVQELVHILNDNLKQSTMKKLSEPELRKSNPWLKLEEGKYVLGADQSHVAKAKEKASSRFIIQDNLPPEPFHGNPFNAEIFLLALNPGYVEKEQEYLGKNNGLKDALLANLAFGNEKYPLIFMDPRFKDSPGREWWDKKLAPLFKLGYTPEVIAKRVCHLQFFPYHSTSYKGSKTLLDSQRYTFDLLRYAIQNKKMIILLRSERLWTEQVPELKGNYCKLNSYRNVILSENNLGVENFSKLRKLLDNNLH